MRKWVNNVCVGVVLLFGAFGIILLSVPSLRSQIMQISGLAVAQSSSRWNPVKDAAQGDNLTFGIMASQMYGFDGTNYDRVRVDASGSINTSSVGATTPSDNFANPTTAQLAFALVAGYDGATWDRLLTSTHGDSLTTASGLNIASFGYVFDGANWDRMTGTSGRVNITQDTSGSAFYAIKRDNIAAVSVNLAFGFTSKKVIIETPASNTDEVAVDWLGGVAVAPAANTAGDDRIAAGRIVTFDNYAVTSISVIAASGTQTIYVRAFN